MSVCGSVGGEEPLCEWNGPPWKHFIENQCEVRRSTDRRPNLGGEGEEPQTERLILRLVCNLPYDGE